MNDDKNTSQPGSPSQPLHHTPHTWEERTHQQDEYIRDSAPFEGKWQSYVDDSRRLIVPKELHKLFSSGGVVTVSTEKHLLLFGSVHWLRFQRLLAKEVGLGPVNNEVARHTYSYAYRFNKLGDEGTIALPTDLLRYAGIKSDVAIIGLVYLAEIHDKDTYVESQRATAINGRLARFKKIDFNQ